MTMKKSRKTGPNPSKGKRLSKLGLTKDEVMALIAARVWKEAFTPWLSGQTCPVLENGEPGYFSHDVERFLDAIIHRKVTYFD